MKSKFVRNLREELPPVIAELGIPIEKVMCCMEISEGEQHYWEIILKDGRKIKAKIWRD